MPGCCGQRRRSSDSTVARRTLDSAAASQQHVIQPSMVTSNTVVSVDTHVPDLAALGDPGPGNVWAIYVGGRGMGSHDRRGMQSRKKYMRVKYGDRVAVKAADAVTKEHFEANGAHGDFIILSELPKQSPAPRPPGEKPKEIVRRMPAKSVPRTPVLTADVSEFVEVMAQKSLRELKDWLDISQFTLEQLTSLRAAEAEGANRIGAIKMLDKLIQA